MIEHVKTTPKRPAEISEIAIPLELDEIVMRCLQKKPADRYQSARELETALEAVPLAEPWSRDIAQEWWDLHGILGERPLDCECFFADEELAAQEGPIVAARTTA